jgi:hypothetical protein
MLTPKPYVVLVANFRRIEAIPVGSIIPYIVLLAELGRIEGIPVGSIIVGHKVLQRASERITERALIPIAHPSEVFMDVGAVAWGYCIVLVIG